MNTLARYIFQRNRQEHAVRFALLLALFAFFDMLNQLQDIGKAASHRWMVFMFVGRPAGAYFMNCFRSPADRLATR